MMTGVYVPVLITIYLNAMPCDGLGIIKFESPCEQGMVKGSCEFPNPSDQDLKSYNLEIWIGKPATLTILSPLHHYPPVLTGGVAWNIFFSNAPGGTTHVDFKILCDTYSVSSCMLSNKTYRNIAQSDTSSLPSISTETSTLSSKALTFVNSSTQTRISSQRYEIASLPTMTSYATVLPLVTLLFSSYAKLSSEPIRRTNPATPYRQHISTTHTTSSTVLLVSTSIQGMKTNTSITNMNTDVILTSLPSTSGWFSDHGGLTLLNMFDTTMISETSAILSSTEFWPTPETQWETSSKQDENTSMSTALDTTRLPLMTMSTSSFEKISSAVFSAESSIQQHISATRTTLYESFSKQDEKTPSSSALLDTTGVPSMTMSSLSFGKMSSAIFSTKPSSIQHRITVTRVTSCANLTTVCTCVKKSYQFNGTDKERLAIIDSIKNKMRIEKSKLSSTVRKLTSANDKRKSSQRIGAVGITVLAVVIGLIIMIDLMNMKRHL